MDTDKMPGQTDDDSDTNGDMAGEQKTSEAGEAGDDSQDM